MTTDSPVTPDGPRSTARPQRVLLTGAAGFLGSALVRRLGSSPVHRVVALDRRPLPPGLAALPSVEAVVGDVRDRTLLGRLAAEADVVVHGAAALPSHPAAEIRSVDVDGTRTVLDAARRAGTDRVLHISSTAVYGLPERTPTPETHPLVPVDPYNAAKIAAERLCADYRDRGMCVPVLRPKTFIGPGRLGVFAMLFDWALDGRGFPVLGGGHTLNQMLDVEDLCDLVTAVLTLPGERVNREFNVGAAEYGSFREDCQVVLDLAGHGKRVVPLPLGPAKAALRTLAALRLSPVYGRLVQKLTRDSCVDITDAREVLGFTPRHSNATAIERSFTWYRANRSAVAGTTGRTHSDRWREGALRTVKVLF
ncbi:NAD-dependent epimerase/dehydratase family protein [Kitasatospora sp. NPDC058184]|uniref:NAD-dependent epimerase/dehydratase family protein n=1 Tax=unclassified Kitasatospora TaxID=2633591 RepID=UPI0036BFB00D